MKKRNIVILVIFSVIVAAAIGGGVTYFVLNKKNESQIKQINENIQEIEKNTESVSKNNSATNKNTNGYNTGNNQTKEKKKRYTHIALQGCVITESNSETGAVTYKKKCETCGTVQPGTISTYLTGGIMNSGFYCSNCKKTQTIQIETTSSYE